MLEPLTTRSARVGHVFLDDPGIAVAEHHGAPRIADEFRGALDHAMTLALGGHFHFARAGHLEALLGPALGLQFGHFLLLLCLGPYRTVWCWHSAGVALAPWLTLSALVEPVAEIWAVLG